MLKLKLQLLLLKYKKEIAQGNMDHVNDFIAVTVLLNLFYINAYTDEDLRDINLQKLIYYFSSVEEMEVPTLAKISILKKKYKKELKRIQIPFNYITENAAIIWIELMIKYGMIHEGDIINLKDYVITDFMTDEKLISMFEMNNTSIEDYKYTRK